MSYELVIECLALVAVRKSWEIIDQLKAQRGTLDHISNIDNLQKSSSFILY